jgi:hypothetical protein
MEDERTECRWFTHQEVHTMIRTGRIAGAKTIVGFLVWRSATL